MSRRLEEAKRAYNEAAKRNGLQELPMEETPAVAGPSITGDMPRDLIKNPYPQVAPEAQAPEAQAPVASSRLADAQRKYAEAHDAATARGADLSGAPAPAPSSREPAAAPAPAPAEDFLEGGRVGTTQGEYVPDWKSRAKYKNFSNDEDAGLAALQRDNPTLDIRNFRNSEGDMNVVSRKKLPQGQTTSEEPWSPMDPSGTIFTPIDYYKKFGIVGGAQELGQDVLDDVYTIGSGVAQQVATGVGALAGGVAGIGAGSIPAGMLGASASSAAAGATLNALKQAIGT